MKKIDSATMQVAQFIINLMMYMFIGYIAVGISAKIINYCKDVFDDIDLSSLKINIKGTKKD